MPSFFTKCLPCTAGIVHDDAAVDCAALRPGAAVAAAHGFSHSRLNMPNHF
jgi:hypothetical protein